MRNCIHPVLVNANNTSHFRNPEGQQNKSRQRDFPVPQPHIRILYWLCGEGGIRGGWVTGTSYCSQANSEGKRNRGVREKYQINYLDLSHKSSCSCAHHEGIWVSWCIVPCIHNLGIRWRWVISLTTRPLYPRGKTPSKNWTEKWVHLRAGMEVLDKRKISCTYQEMNYDSSIGQPVPWSLHRLRYPCPNTQEIQVDAKN